MRSWKASNFAVLVLLLAIASFASATVIFNTTQMFPQNFYNSSNITGQFFTFNVSNQSNTLNIVNVTLMGNFTGTWADNVSNASAVVNAQNFTLNLTGMTNGFFVWNLKVWAFDASATVSLTQMTSNNTLIVDNIAPNVTTVNSPANNLNASGSGNITFSTTASDNILMANVSIFHNATGTWHRNATNSSISSLNNASALLVSVASLPANVSFIWITEVCDVAGNCGFHNANRTAIIDLTGPNVTAENTGDNSNSSSQSITFSATVTDNVQIANLSIYHNATGIWHRNTTNSSLTAIHNNTPILVTVSDIPEGNSSFWKAEACDVAGNCAQYNANRTFIVDLSRPRVQVVNFSKTSDTSAFLNVSISDANAINTTIVSFASTGATTNHTNTLTRFPAAASNTSGYYNMSFTSLGYDTYTIYVYVNDSAGNPNSTASQSITIGPSGGSSGGSGGGGSFSSSPATPTPAPSVSKIPSPSEPSASPTPFSPPSASPTPSLQVTPTPTPNPALVAAASVAIASASNSLADARGKGVDVSAAENLLALARQAQAAGKFVQAQQYADDAKRALQSLVKTVASPQASASQSTPAPLPLNWIIGGVVVLLAAGAYLWMQRTSASK